MNPLEVVHKVVNTRFPDCQAALFTGSAAEGFSTKYSDLDVIVVLDGPPAPFRETFRANGWLVELFVHDDASIQSFFASEREQGVATLATMIANGEVVAGSVDELQDSARRHLSEGPPRPPVDEIDYCRYLLTADIDDLLGARDADERDMVAVRMLVGAGELHLKVRGHWTGRGKWLLRQLRDCDPVIAAKLVEGNRSVIARGDKVPLIEVCDEILLPVGGRLADDYTVR